MVIVTGIIHIDAADAEAAKAAASNMAVATRAEDGCITYAFYEDIENPGRFRVYEEWRDLAALGAHGKAPHMADFRKALAGLNVLGTDLKMIEGGTEKPLG